MSPSGWLVGQLPRVLREDPVIAGFATAGEELGDSLRTQIDTLEHQLDPALTSAPMLAYLASWLGFPLDSWDDPDFHRPLLPVLGRVVQLRGTRAGLRLLAAALTRGPVEVLDPGGVYGPADRLPPTRRTVLVRVTTAEPLGLERLRSILVRQVPVGATVQLEVGPPSADHDSATTGD